LAILIYQLNRTPPNDPFIKSVNITNNIKDAPMDLSALWGTVKIDYQVLQICILSNNAIHTMQKTLSFQPAIKGKLILHYDQCYQSTFKIFYRILWIRKRDAKYEHSWISV